MLRDATAIQYLKKEILACQIDNKEIECEDMLVDTLSSPKATQLEREIILRIMKKMKRNIGLV